MKYSTSTLYLLAFSFSSGLGALSLRTIDPAVPGVVQSRYTPVARRAIDYRLPSGGYPGGYYWRPSYPYSTRPLGRPLTSIPSPPVIVTSDASTDASAEGGNAEDSTVIVPSGGVNYDGDGASGGRIVITRVPGGISNEATITRRAVREKQGKVSGLREFEKHVKHTHQGHKPTKPHAHAPNTIKGAQPAKAKAAHHHPQHSTSKAALLPTGTVSSITGVATVA